MQLRSRIPRSAFVSEDSSLQAQAHLPRVKQLWALVRLNLKAIAGIREIQKELTPPPSPPPPPTTRVVKAIDACNVCLRVELCEDGSLLQISLLHIKTAAPIPASTHCRISFEAAGAPYESEVLTPIASSYTESKNGQGLLLFSSGISSGLSSLQPSTDYEYLYQVGKCGVADGLCFDDDGKLIERKAVVAFKMPRADAAASSGAPRNALNQLGAVVWNSKSK